MSTEDLLLRIEQLEKRVAVLETPAFIRVSPFVAPKGAILLVADTVAREAGYTRRQLLQKDRSERKSWARFVVMHIASECLMLAHSEIGKTMNFGTSNVCHSCIKVRNRMSVDPRFKAEVGRLIMLAVTKQNGASRHNSQSA